MRPFFKDKDTTLYISPIIKLYGDYVKFFGKDAETIINYAQRHFKSISRQNEWLTTRCILYAIYGCDNIIYSTDGKPSLKSGEPHISISHSKTHVAVLLSRFPHVGVDIEKIDDKVLGFCQRFLSAEILPKQYLDFNNAQKAKLMIALWTAKEAVYKSIENQNAINLLKDITITRYNKTTSFPEIATVNNMSNINLHSFEYQDNICSYTNY